MADSTRESVEVIRRSSKENGTRRELFCPHCDRLVPKTTYYRHKEQFYDPDKGSWSTVKVNVTTNAEAINEFEDEEAMDTDFTTNEDNFPIEGVTTEVASDSEVIASTEEASHMASEDEEFFESDEEFHCDYFEDDAQEVWIEDEVDSDDNNNSSVFTPIIQLLFSYLIVWQLLFHISDSAMKAIAAIIKKFIILLSAKSNCCELKDAGNSIPKSYNGILKFAGLGSYDIISFVVCPSCNSIYDYDQCFEVRCGQKVPLKCKYVAFPNHSHRDQRQPCGASLLKEVKLQSTRKVKLTPIKTYPYQRLKDAIAALVSDPNFLNTCDHWRKRTDEVPAGILADVYDGEVWKDFNSEKYSNFLSRPGNLLLSLNVDWFQPFRRTKYSVGVMYLVILNLPRDERYKIENIILSGIIPGPKEPKLTMNPFIAPLVQELNDAFKGWVIATNHPILKTVCIRLCVGIVVCDIPATRKLCGFLGHSARLGCNKCVKEFPTESFGKKPDFSGYERTEWEVRTKDKHKQVCSRLLQCNSKSQLESLETESGIRYSIMIDLPLFDPISFVLHIICTFTYVS